MDIEAKILRKIVKGMPRTTICPVVLETPRYFHLKPKDKYVYVSARLEHMKQPFLDLLGIKEFHPVDTRSQDSFYTYGIISSINGDKIANECYLFNTSDGSRISPRLDLDSLDGYSIFNGQVVAIKGTNVDGSLISVERLYGLPIINVNTAQRIQTSVSVLKGPFSPGDVADMADHECSCLILLGPFCSFDGHAFSYFEQFVGCLEESIKTCAHLKVVLVPSADDYCSVSIFPQPAHKIANDRIVALPNPSCFYINNHMVTISNFDGYADLCSEEVFKKPTDSSGFLLNADKTTRLSYHLVFQRSFVPVLSSKSGVAYGSWLNMSIAPDLYIICSKASSFRREVGPTTVLNMGESKRCTILSQESRAKYSIDLSAQDG